MEYDNHIIEYVIKCEDCQDLVDCRVDEFLDFRRKGFSIKESLDKMYIFRECTRTRFIVPSKIPLEMENRNLIEGRIPYNPSLKPDKDVVENAAVILGSVVKIGGESKKFAGENDLLDFQIDDTYVYPTELGIPVINQQDFPASKYTKFAGAGKVPQILSGKKYICL